MKDESDELRARRLLADYIAAWNRHDAVKLASLFAEDGCYGEFGQGAVLFGHEVIRRYLSAKFSTLPGLTNTLTAYPTWNGAQVIYKWAMTATPRGEFAGVSPTGRPFRVPGATVLVVEDDKIARAADYYDVRTIARQLRFGLTPGSEGPASGFSFVDADIISSPDFPVTEDNIRYGE